MNHKKGMLIALCLIVIANSLILAQNAIVKDVDGNLYNTVIIGNQIWMKENLKVTKYRNGDPISNITDSIEWTKNHNIGAYCVYNNSTANAKTYGYLYNWYTVVDSRNLCPSGWHVPSTNEWNDLENYLTSNGYGYQGEGNNIAKSLASTTGWVTTKLTGCPSFDPGSNNKSGFSALPGGTRSSDVTTLSDGNNLFFCKFTDINKVAKWWTSTEEPLAKDDNDLLVEEMEGSGDPSLNAYGVKIDYVSGKLYISSKNSKDDGYAVRCLKDK
jgi:uncharacterized protein (TIGR02145 family)